MKPIMIGTTATVTTTADESKLAVTVGSGSLRVYATPMMSAILEEAACKANVTAEAEIIGVSGREVTYSITARDECGEIGSCIHKRVQVGADRFMQKASSKKLNQ